MNRCCLSQVFYNGLEQATKNLPHPFAQVPCGADEKEVECVSGLSFEIVSHQPEVVFEVADDRFYGDSPAKEFSHFRALSPGLFLLRRAGRS